jgi:hypothetical protein
LMSRTANGEFLFGATEDFKTSLACFFFTERNRDLRIATARTKPLQPHP